MPTGTIVSKKLAEAEVELRAAKPSAALAPLLVAWRATPDPALADVIDRLSDAIGADGRVLEGKTGKARHASWLAMAAKGAALDVGFLLELLLEGVRSPEATERLGALDGFAPDPRIARALAALAEHPPFQAATTKPFWTKLYPLLVTHADPRTLTLLAPLSDSYVGLVGAEAMGKTMKSKLDKALAALRARFPTARALDGPDRVILDRIDPLVGGARPSAEADAERRDLVQAVYDAPDDDGPRLVLADWLQERGDPWGELIALQFKIRADALRGERTAEDEKRVLDIFVKHGRGWIGALFRPLGPMTPPWREHGFERGFLTRARFAPSAPQVIDTCVGNPAWSTVEELTVLTTYDAAPLFRAPVFGALRTLGNVQAPVVHELVTRRVTPRLRRLRCQAIDPADEAALDELTALEELAVVPYPTGKLVSVEDVERLLALPFAARLAKLSFGYDASGNPAVLHHAIKATTKVALSFILRDGFGPDAGSVAVARTEGSRPSLVIDLHEANVGRSKGPLARLLGGAKLGTLARVTVVNAEKTVAAEVVALGATLPIPPIEIG